MNALLWASVVLADSYVVDESGAGDALTIAEGLSLLADGDTLEIRGGVYYESHLWTEATDVTISGAGSSNTIIDGSMASLDDEYLLSIVSGEVTGVGFTGRPLGYGLSIPSASFEGSGVRVANCNFEGLWTATVFSDTSTVEIDSVLFGGNERAIWVYRGVEYLTVVNSVFLGNDRPFYVNEPSSGPRGLYWTIAHNTLVGNTIGVDLEQGSSNYWGTPYVVIANNVIAAADMGIYVQGYNGTAFSGYIKNNLIAEDVAVAEFYQQSGIVAEGNLVGAPGFVSFSDDDDWTNDNVRLDWSSDGIDLGTEDFYGVDATATDADGTARPLDGDLDGVALPDAGAWEADADLDRDGFGVMAAGGDDCDDGEPGVHPGAEDICGDGVDQDCSGADAECPDTGDTAPPVDTQDTDTTDSDAPAIPGDTASKVPGQTPGCGCATLGPPYGVGLIVGALVSRRVARRRIISTRHTH